MIYLHKISVSSTIIHRCSDYLQLNELEKVKKIQSIDFEMNRLLSQQRNYRNSIRKYGFLARFEAGFLRCKFSAWELGFRESSEKHTHHIEFSSKDIYGLDISIGNIISKLSSTYGFNNSCY